MAGTNEIKAFATGVGADVLTPTAYAAMTELASGFVNGVADPAKLNTVWRQASFVAAAVAQYVADAGLNALDDGNLTSLVSNLRTAIASQIDAQSGNYALDTGLANAYVIALDPPIAANKPGMAVRFKAINANTGGASTLDAGAGATALVNDQGGALVPGDIPAGSIVTAVFDAAANAYMITTTVSSQIFDIIPAGLIMPYAGVTPPAGFLACPNGVTNISRATYSRLYAAIGTTWGVGDGATTFGMPYIPYDLALLNNNSANIATQTAGQNLAHTHNNRVLANYIAAGNASAGSNMFYNSSNFSAAISTDSQGGSKNLPAGIRMQYCVKY